MPSLSITLAAIILCLTPQLSRGQAPAADQAPPPTAPPVPPVETKSPAERQMESSIVQVRLMEQIAAKIDQDVDMLNQKFKLEGSYYKDYRNNTFKVRLQLNLVGLGDTGSTMLQVCDGKIRWDMQKVLGMQSYKKLEIVPVMKKLDDPSLDRDLRINIISNMGFGGPEAMLSGLNKAVKFEQFSEEKLDGIDVFVIGGTWRDRSNLMGPNDRPLPPTSPLPPYIPSNVRVFVGKLNGWPYKIEMIGNAPSLLQEETREIDKFTNRPIGQPRKAPKVDPSRVTLRYTLLDPLTEIKPGLFDFTAPADVAATNVKDETEEYLSMLSQVIENAAILKKAEAAKAEGEPLLKAKPIEVGRDPSAPGGLGTVPTPEGASPK